VATAQTDPNDWQEAAPGVQHLIGVADLPSPYETPSAGNFPTVVARPANATCRYPPGFTVKRFASGLINPRIVRVAPNGDIFAGICVRVLNSGMLREGAEIEVLDSDRPARRRLP
jgi:hypothetical protein